MSSLVEVITSTDALVRNQALERLCASATLEELTHEASALELFRRHSTNLYDRVRALFFLAAIYRYYVPPRLSPQVTARLPFGGYEHLLQRRFEEAIREFRSVIGKEGLSETLASGLSAAYRGLAFQTLADQVRRSVRSVKGNRWMFRVGHPLDHPLYLHADLLREQNGLFPVLKETTPVRMDLSHSAWSDIFFLGMDYPEGAQVLNISVDLSVRGRGDAQPKPPIETFFRVIDEPVLRLVSVDLKAQTDITTVDEVFDFARDYLGLLKAAVIASGVVPSGLEGCRQPITPLLLRLIGREGHGIEIVSHVNDIPKGSRLAVSTNLLASLITVCMRATRQIQTLTGPLTETERRHVAARAILGEWLGGSGGGWQDSGGVWPGMKLITGVPAAPQDPEYGVSRGCLLPRHRILGENDASLAAREELQNSLVLVHGGMAQDVGPILEMVTERYLLRSEVEWEARQKAQQILRNVLDALRAGDLRELGACTDANYRGPIQTIIPWAGNFYTDQLIAASQQRFGNRFRGFWMLGGMAGGGMGFMFDPEVKPAAQSWLAETMLACKKRLESAVPFAMDPVVYDFAINERGTWAELLNAAEVSMPPAYYGLRVPQLVRQELRHLPPGRRSELQALGEASRNRPEMTAVTSLLIDHLLPRESFGADQNSLSLDATLQQNGFDRIQHEAVRADLKAGLVGLAQNLLPRTTRIEDAADGVIDTRAGLPRELEVSGAEAIRMGQVAIVTLAGGAGSRWTGGAGVVKAIHPFARLGGQYRTFLEVHLAKTRQTSDRFGGVIPHVFTTSYLTDGPIAAHLREEGNYGFAGPVWLSRGRSVGLRMIPMTRDLRFLWEQTPQQTLDAQKQKVRDSLRAALITWAEKAGEGSDYRDNVPSQCLHPVGHWYEFPNMLLNGVLRSLLAENPGVKHLLLHNVDTLGAEVDPALLQAHIASGAAMSVEVIARAVDDRGGGLARVDGRVRLVEGLALPDERLEFEMSYYNTGTMWINIDRILAVFGLTRQQLGDAEGVVSAVRRAAARVPTYITIKDVKKRWGRGQEDVYPVSQFEKIWGDMTALPEVHCQYFAVTRMRGQQLKHVAQLDGWLRDGSAAYVERLCGWSHAAARG